MQQQTNTQSKLTAALSRAENSEMLSRVCRSASIDRATHDASAASSLLLALSPHLCLHQDTELRLGCCWNCLSDYQIHELRFLKATPWP